ncbi:MAG: 50S ribosomal protein L4 [Nanoarchaeota archaeon]
MKLSIVTIDKTEIGKIELPGQFQEEIRPDLIRRAVLAIQSHKRQPYGAMPGAGQRASAKLSRRRRNYRGSYGLGISRVPRKILSRRGTRMNWVGAVAPGMVGGRRAHPPKAGKNWRQKVNEKENRKAIRSALAASITPHYCTLRGHRLPQEYPFIVEDKFEELKRTKEVYAALEKLGFAPELGRTKEKKLRPGKGKRRGRKYQQPKGPLLVVSKDCNLLSAGKNIPGVEIVPVNQLNAELLAPGTHPGRLTIYTEAALRRLDKEKLFTESYHREKIPLPKAEAEKKAEPKKALGKIKKEKPAKKKDTPAASPLALKEKKEKKTEKKEKPARNTTA